MLRAGPQADGTGLVALDPWLKPYTETLRRRYARYQAKLDEIVRAEGSLDAFTRGYEYFGLNRGQRDGVPGVWYREWAPGAQHLSLIGDFNGWDRSANSMQRDGFGVWSTFLSDEQYANRLVHGSRVKVHVESAAGPMDRIPAYIRRAVYDPLRNSFDGQHWAPPTPYVWQYGMPRVQGSLRVYESHVGMAVEEHRVGSYTEFARNVLPHAAAGGYNAIQLMAVQEHPYYGSFGYHVSSFFAPSSRFGTPEELKALIDAAHGMGLLVLLDVVHSHAVKNVHEGLNRFDGTDHQYFHAGPRGLHPAWDSLLFDYDKWEVLRFLLSNVRYWLSEFHFDGFRFDGVTSMMYLHHGLGRAFSGYDDYFGPDVDEPAITYLQLANQVIHEVAGPAPSRAIDRLEADLPPTPSPEIPWPISVAEDVSGMPGLCRPIADGGIGFDSRLAMGVPDYWIKILKERRDEEWSMGDIYHVLTNRRANELHIAYAESHDQALVGDNTIAFRLMDADMYWHMSKAETGNPVIERGIALHKMIRLITFSLGGEGYLSFMGNEFGHPEWIDFPREGNNFSYKYARRQWSLLRDVTLRYRDLNEFDREMVALDPKWGLLADPLIERLQVHESNQLLIYRRGPLVFAFNFHPTASYADYRFGVPDATDYRMILNTDDVFFGGHGIVRPGQHYPWQSHPWDGRNQSIQIYIPARSAQVLAPMQWHG